jgi:hypothetical protein
MGIFRPQKPSTNPAVVNATIERDTAEEIERAPPRRSRDNENGMTAKTISDGVARIAGEPLAEIGRMIAELTQLRDHLQMEAERVEDEIARVHAEIAGYTQMSEDAVQSLRAIDRAMGDFKGAMKPG